MHHNTAKRQKVDEKETAEEAVLFNSDALSKIISYLPSVDVLNLAVTCKRFGISDNDESLIEECARIAVQDTATDEQLAALPHYNGESSLADYHYLQLMRGPLTFDQFVGAEYVNSGDKSCVRHNRPCWATAVSNNILRAGKHYVSFTTPLLGDVPLYLGLMRPGQINQNVKGHPFSIPLYKPFFQRFSRRLGGECNINNNSIQCCIYNTCTGVCKSSDWGDSNEPVSETWEGSETMSSGDEIGMLLDLDEGTLSVYKNGRKLGIMKRGLAGQYCWMVSMWKGTIVTINRGAIPS